MPIIPSLRSYVDRKIKESGGGGGIASYSSKTNFPSSPTDGELALVLDEDIIYVYDGTNAVWLDTGRNGSSSGATIDDTTASTTTVYSSSKTEDLLTGKSDTTHTHTDLHNHSNKSHLDKVTASGTETSFDLSGLATKTSVDGKVDKATPSVTGNISIDKTVPKVSFNHGNTGGVTEIFANTDGTNDYGFLMKHLGADYVKLQGGKTYIWDSVNLLWQEAVHKGNESAGGTTSNAFTDVSFSADFSVGTSTAHTRLNFDVVNKDVNTEWDGTNFQWVASKDYSKIKITVNLTWKDSASGERFYPRIRGSVNGLTFLGEHITGAGGTYHSQSFSYVATDVKTGNWIAIEARNMASATRNIIGNNGWTRVTFEEI